MKVFRIVAPLLFGATAAVAEIPEIVEAN